MSALTPEETGVAMARQECNTTAVPGKPRGGSPGHATNLYCWREAGPLRLTFPTASLEPDQAEWCGRLAVSWAAEVRRLKEADAS